MSRSEVNGFRVSVFLAASATGHTLPPLIVFAGVSLESEGEESLVVADSC
ncbi:hypothetical protein L917_06180 [Phytophthora nicotianae]|uniref:Uncharacterized protein n=1 Tax=Phytophthora nicotianae TaxID=4792 RepID=W2LFM7_PHYNI|nr:hypothetical protein L916_06310 [Phytophthora nicotianae]ETL96237.1 hypothetical protein L917_06180 [Phytophthora nicotianae]